MKTITSALAASLMLGGAFLAYGQHDQHKASKPTKAPTMAMCKQMMANQEKMMAHMKDMDLKMDALVETMDSATGESKTNATAAALKELVAQRKMHSMMQGKNGDMMGHMMQHMAGGKMMDCPMMKGKMGGGR